MKHQIPIRLTNRTDNSLLSGKQIQFMMRMLLLLVFVFSAMDITAQTAKGTRSAAASQSESTVQAIVHVDQFLQSLQAAKPGNAKRVKSLLNDVQPSAYVEAGAVKTYGSSPVCLFTDVRSFSSLGSLNLPQSVEIVTVKFKNQSDLSAALDLSVLSAFPRLQYVYLVSEVNVTGPKIISIVHNTDPRYSVFYNIPTLH